jgi:AcrR family transcriptional regulator
MLAGARCVLTATCNPGMIRRMNERSFPLRPAQSRASRGLHTREAILEGAFDLFLHQGYHGTSMRQIAREARLSPAAIYNHFESKEALFTGLLLARLPQRALARALAQARGRGADELVHDALHKMGEAMSDQYDNLRLVFIELLEFQGRHAAEAAVEILPEAFEFATRLQQADCRLRTLDPSIITRAFLGLFMSHAIALAFFRQIPSLGLRPGDLDALGDIFLYGVLDERRALSQATPAAP